MDAEQKGDEMFASTLKEIATTTPEGFTLREILTLFGMETTAGRRNARQPSAVLETLLTSSEVAATSFSSEKQNIWLRESDHRDLCLVHLVLLLTRRNAIESSRGQQNLQLQQAARVAAAYRALSVQRSISNFSCSNVTQELVGSIVSLFAQIVPGMRVNIDLKIMQLSPLKLRALALLIGIVTLRTICSSAILRQTGYIESRAVNLAEVLDAVSIITSANIKEIFQVPGLEVLSGLAAVLSSDFVCNEDANGRTCIELQIETVSIDA